ncbi:peptidase C54, partial [Syncephalis pseudoplumigaleata]
FRPTLILVAIRLGIDELNPLYHPAVKMCLAFPQSVGIAGGRPSASLYFVGFDGDDLFYLDPHCTRATVSTKAPATYTDEDLASYHCPRPRSIRIHRLDPSMLIGFYCRDRQDF